MFKTNKTPLKKVTEGRVYVFQLELETTTTVYKVGICNSDRTVDRFIEVLKAFFMVYRYVPKAKILKFKKFNNPLIVEKHLHSLLEDCKYSFSKKFGGSTEFFTDVDVDPLLEYIEEFTYDKLLQCTSLSEKDYDAIYKELPTTDLVEGDIPF